MRLELSLVITVKSAHLGSSERLAVFPDRHADECVELGYGPLRGVDDLVLVVVNLLETTPVPGQP